MEKLAELDWNHLGFSYIKTDYRYISVWKNGSWDDGVMTEDNYLRISEASTALHYGQECFEGLKAYRTKDGSINLFRPDRNAKRMQDSCRKLLMPEFPVERFIDACKKVVKANERFPVERFIDACKKVVKANERFLPPYGTGGTLYLRPYMIGVGHNLGVKPAPEFIFGLFCSPVGAYFKDGLAPCNFCIADYDRAAPLGTGSQKVGGNYAASLLPHKLAADAGFADCIYLDPATHTKIEEVGAANFFGITKDNEFVTPKSPSILPSVTKYSLMEIAEKRFGMKVSERDVYIDRIDEFAEAGACGTAAVITPIGGISYKDKLHVFYSETEVGPTIRKLYDTLVGIQFGEIEPPQGWIFKVE